ncbi:sulfotransferase family protein [Nocardioides sp. SR21]|uniref:sulfotransferase family protein n=1 Tax=Nocardioides sp. SR21 TaxID=2919501 RepID=UPI001FAB0A03|nr:sulfotransferase family protein [Nocardioides sp. SR21]
MTDYPRTVLFVAGAGRSGTSTMAGLMQILGLHVPQPEVVADETNPKGFGEPQWVVENHDRLLREAVVQVSDARPDAWVETDRLSGHEHEQARAAQWLEGHFAAGSELVVKDPRLSWFLTLWRVAAARTGARPVFATMLRPPAEVVGSRQTYYQSRLGSAHLAASWLNVLLHTELATRGSDRAFVRYGDLLSDWKSVVMPVGEQLGLAHVQHASPAAIAEGDRFVDPDLRRMTQTLDDLGLPPRLHELTAQTWAELNRLAEPGGDTAEVHEALDQLRAGYVDLYAESEAITRSSVVAAEQCARRTPGKPAAPAPSGADRIPHGVRALVPAPLRRGVRKVLRRPR